MPQSAVDPVHPTFEPHEAPSGVSNGPAAAVSWPPQAAAQAPDQTTAQAPAPAPDLTTAQAPVPTAAPPGPTQTPAVDRSAAQSPTQPRASLRSLRILALLCIGLPLLVYAVVGASRYNQIRAESEVRLDRSLRIAEEHAQRVLEADETVLERVIDALGSDDPVQIRAREASLHAQLVVMSQSKPQIHSILVLDADGVPLVSDRIFPLPRGAAPDERSFFRWHKDMNPGPHISKPWMDPLTAEVFFDMSHGRILPGGIFGGTVSLSLPPAYFEGFHGNLAADEPGLAITLLRDDGMILSRWPAVADAPAALAEDSPVMSKIRAGVTRGTARGVSSVDNRKRLFAFAKVGNYPIYVGTGMDVAEIRQRWGEEMTWLVAFGLPPMLGLFLAARVALRRTRDVLDAAQRLSEETLARRRVEETLLQSQKLEALGRLTGGVAHDFNNALMVISNNLFLLKRKHPEIEGARIDSIGRAVGSATKLTRQLLAFSRRQALVPEHMRLQDRLPTFQDLLEPVLGRNVRLAVEAAPDTRPIVVDSAEFELALINLAVNARDAMPGGGGFTLRARNAESHELPAGQKWAMVIVEAVDTGTGIEPQVLDKVFEPFFTTKPVGTGTGLGLSQIYGLCQRAGGIATIESKVGVGTVVRLWFPAAIERAAEAAHPPPVSPIHLAKSLLLVEDNDEVAAALQPVLQALGCHVVRLDGAEAALGWLRRQARLPDVLLTDVVMPGEMDGLGLAQAVRSRYPTMRVVLMTGYAEQMEAISRQGFDIVPKPCSAETLAAAIARGSEG